MVSLLSSSTYLRTATQEYTRKVLIMQVQNIIRHYSFLSKTLVLQTDKRFAVGIFIRGQIPWDEDPVVGANAVVCSLNFLAPDSSDYRYPSTTYDFRLHCSSFRLQLYSKQMADTFTFVNQPMTAMGTEMSASVSLQKISNTVQRVSSMYYLQLDASFICHIAAARSHQQDSGNGH